MSFLRAALLVLLCGCAASADRARAAPAPNQVAEADVCPPGTDENSTSSAPTDCQDKAGVDLRDESKAIVAHCFRKGGAIMKCDVGPSACGGRNGVLRVTPRGVECQPGQPVGSSTMP